jgi:hypothetical protein
VGGDIVHNALPFVCGGNNLNGRADEDDDKTNQEHHFLADFVSKSASD